MHRYQTYHLFKLLRKGFILLSILFFMGTLMGAKTGPASTKNKALVNPTHPKINQLKIKEQYGKLPLAFEINEGQTDPQVKFFCRGGGYTMFITQAEAVLTLRSPAPRLQDAKDDIESGLHEKNIHRLKLLTSNSSLLTAASNVIRMRLVGGNRLCKVEGLEKLPGISNYFIGNDPSKWRTKVAQYAKVRMKEVYPGVDMVYYGNQGQLEYDFVVKPGINPNVVRLKVDGAENVQISKEGNLLLKVSDGQVVFKAPIIYQVEQGERKPIEGRYVKATSKEIGFEVMNYDVTKPLVIDPTLAYSTYLGGSAYDNGRDIAVDALGNAYVTGYAYATFPTTAGAYQTAFAGSEEAFVTKLNPTGTALIYSTYLGGTNTDRGFSIAVDGSGSVYITGDTLSTNFPTTTGAFQTVFGGGNESFGDAFVSKLNPTGTSLVYSTYLGGAGSDQGAGIAVDSSGNAYVTGLTASSNFPTTAGAFQTIYGGGNVYYGDAFVTKLNPSGTALVYSTYFGQGGLEFGHGIAVDGTGNAFVTGTTWGLITTTAGAYQTTHGGGTEDTFIIKLNPLGNSLVYSTYLGGSGNDLGRDIVADSSGNAYITGITTGGFITTSSAFQTSFGGGSDDAFITKINAAGSAVLYSTYLGGSGYDEVQGIAIDGFDNVYVIGRTSSNNFPLISGAYQTFFGGGAFDIFLAELNSLGNALIYSTFMGGSGIDQGWGIAVDGSGSIYVVGDAQEGFPTTTGAYQTLYGDGSYDTIVAKFFAADPTPTYTPLPCGYPGETCTFTETPTWTLTRTPTNTSTPTPTFTPTNTSTLTPTRTNTFTSTYTPTLTPTPTITSTATETNTPTVTGTPTDSMTPTASLTASPSNTPTNTGTPTYTPTINPTGTYSPTWTPTASATPTASFTPSFTDSPTPTITMTFTIAPTHTFTSTITMTGTYTITPTRTIVPGAEVFYVSKNAFNGGQDPVSIYVATSKYPGMYRLNVYNSAGERVKKLDEQELTAPYQHSYLWYGDNQYGEKCASGLYIFYLTEPFGTRLARVLLVR